MISKGMKFAIVFSGPEGPGGALSAESLRRGEAGIQLLKKGAVDIVCFIGGDLMNVPFMAESWAEAMYVWAIQQKGLSFNQVDFRGKSIGTIYNVTEDAYPFIVEHQPSDIYWVSNLMHLVYAWLTIRICFRGTKRFHYRPYRIRSWSALFYTLKLAKITLLSGWRQAQRDPLGKGEFFRSIAARRRQERLAAKKIEV